MDHKIISVSKFMKSVDKKLTYTYTYMYVRTHKNMPTCTYMYNSITYTTTIDDSHTVYVLHVSQRLLCEAYVSYTNCKPSIQIKAAVTQINVYE